MRRAATATAIALAVAALAFWLLTRPDPLTAEAIPEHQADASRGEVLFHAGSCLACHEPGEGGPSASLPSGGAPMETPVGVFYPQNLTPDPETGIGGWSELDFVNAMTRGVSPEGRHYFPAFPYTSYRAMTIEDLLDLRAYLMSLEPVASQTPEHAISMLAIKRRGVGLWKRVAFAQAPYAPPEGGSELWKRGAYLVNAPGHCGECHTPKTALMVEDLSHYLEGGPHPIGEGTVPSLRGLVARGEYKTPYSLMMALQNGEELGFEGLSSGGMGKIQTNLAKLPEEDLEAISEYLLSLE